MNHQGGRRWTLTALAALLIAGPLAWASAAEPASAPNPAYREAALTTRAIGKPFPGPARSIGSAANGCLAGGVAMPLSGPGWETLRPERNRFWGNPALVSFLKDMAHKTAPLGSLLIADMAQPRGGHMTFGHGSHQTGVDVDILYRLNSGPLTAEERASPVMDSVVEPNGSLDRARWGTKQTALLKAFASNPQVERIFVNPAIKRALCRTVGGDREWLRTLRPWWGHDEHFHVRIKCPAGDSECKPGRPLPPGDGCAEVDTWFANGEWNVQPKPKPGLQPVYRTTMPAACKVVLGQASSAR